MKKIIFGILVLSNAYALAMQKPARVYDPEKTLQLKSYLNVWHPVKDFPEEAEVKLLIMEGANPNIKADCGFAINCTWLNSIVGFTKEKKYQDLTSLLLYYGADISF